LTVVNSLPFRNHQQHECLKKAGPGIKKQLTTERLKNHTSNEEALNYEEKTLDHDKK
jgi:hypothetical protein